MPEQLHLPSTPAGSQAGPFSNLEVVHSDNLIPRLALSDHDGLHPYRPRISDGEKKSGLIVVNEQNLQPATTSQKAKQRAFGWIWREWTFQERRVARLTCLLILIAFVASAVGGVIASRKAHPRRSDATDNSNMTSLNSEATTTTFTATQIATRNSIDGTSTPNPSLDSTVKGSTTSSSGQNVQNVQIAGNVENGSNVQQIWENRGTIEMGVGTEKTTTTTLASNVETMPSTITEIHPRRNPAGL